MVTPKNKEPAISWRFSANNKKKPHFFKYLTGGKDTPMYEKKLTQDRSVYSEYTSQATRLKNQLLKNPLTRKACEPVLEQLMHLQAYDTITHTLLKRKAPNGLYYFAASIALNQKNYNVALRLIRDIIATPFIRAITEKAIENNDFDALPNIAETIKQYLLHYHKKPLSYCQFLAQHVYAYAGLTLLSKHQYDLAIDYLKKAPRCLFAWEEALSTLIKQEAFFEIEHLAQASATYSEQLYKQAALLCPKDKAWQPLFLNKAKASSVTLQSHTQETLVVK